MQSMGQLTLYHYNWTFRRQRIYSLDRMFYCFIMESGQGPNSYRKVVPYLGNDNGDLALSKRKIVG